MAKQLIYVDDEAPGECGDAGLVYNGSTTLTSSKIIAGTSMTMSGTAAITGNTTVGGTLAVTGNTTVGGILGVTGEFALDSVTVTGNTTVGGTLAVTGNTAIAGPLGVTGESTLASVLVTGASTLASVLVTGATEINGGLTCDTNAFTVADHSGNTATRGTLDVLGATTLTGDLAANGNTVVAGTLSVAGATTHTNKVAFGATENAAASGAWAIPITTLYDGATTNATAALAATLADGVVGQMKIIMLTTKNTNNMIVTPANLNGGTTITFDATGEFALLVFVGTGWTVIHTTATVA